jgi:hypothetical protein
LVERLRAAGETIGPTPEALPAILALEARIANDLLPHLITWLNDRDWQLRAAFFEHIVGAAVFLGPMPANQVCALVRSAVDKCPLNKHRNSSCRELATCFCSISRNIKINIICSSHLIIYSPTPRVCLFSYPGVAAVHGAGAV